MFHRCGIWWIWITRDGYFNAKVDWNIDMMRSAYTPPSETGRKAASARLRKVYPHPKSEYAPIRDTVHYENPTSASSLLPRRNFEGVGSGATMFQTSSIDGKTEERLANDEQYCESD